MINLKQMYEFTDHTSKKYQNELSVDFVFNGDITSDEAVEQIEMLVKLADNNNKISFINWKPSMYMKTSLVRD